MELSDELLTENTLRAYQKNKLYEVLGNVHWQDGKIDLATDSYEKSLSLGVDLESQRAQWVKLDAMQRPREQAQPLMKYLLGQLQKKSHKVAPRRFQVSPR